GDAGYPTVSAGITAGLTLALAVRRAAENASGAGLPVRPASATVRVQTLSPPPPGPWVTLSLPGHVMVVTLDPAGSLSEVTTVAWTAGPPGPFAARMQDPSRWTSAWSWVHPDSAVTRWRDTLRVSVSLGSPLAQARGELVSQVSQNGLVSRLEGVSGDLTG